MLLEMQHRAEQNLRMEPTHYNPMTFSAASSCKATQKLQPVQGFVALA
jgi:hypothetical protein